MSLYHSISDITQNHVRDEASAHDYLERVCRLLDGLGRELEAVRHIEAGFAHQQIEQLFSSDENKPSLLHAVPLAHKELYGRKPEDQDKGWPFEGGSRACEGQTAHQNAHVIDLLDAHGAIDCGRLVSVEYALGVTGHNAYAGTPKNPFHTDYICGGSSSGSAAMIAAGILPASLGSDTGGSIRLPAAACGLVGLKPTYGLVSRHGVFPLSQSLDTVGPLSRNVEDSAMILSAIAGYDPRDSTSIELPATAYHENLEAPVTGVRVGLGTGYFMAGATAEIADKVSNAFEQFERFGAKLTETDIAEIADTNPLNVMLISTEAADIHLDSLSDTHTALNPQTLMRILTGLYTDTDSYRRLCQLRASLSATLIDKIFEHADVLITPVWPFSLPTIAQSDVGAKPEAAALMQQIGHNTRPVNFLGLPAIVLPIGLDRNGLPVSMQIVGKPYSEHLLLRLARHFERDLGFWENRYLYTD